jgi:hypothetical protein
MERQRIQRFTGPELVNVILDIYALPFSVPMVELDTDVVVNRSTLLNSKEGRSAKQIR